MYDTRILLLNLTYGRIMNFCNYNFWPFKVIKQWDVIGQFSICFPMDASFQLSNLYRVLHHWEKNPDIPNPNSEQQRFSAPT